jgi:luciferase family oxidoreductase group 1
MGSRAAGVGMTLGLTRLSAIDSQWPGRFAETASFLEQHGYYRYWLTEHHTKTQSASPMLLAALAAGVTERIRVGTAGILLHYAAPLRLAEDFRLLQLFYGDRLDLGVAAAVVAEPLGSALLDGRAEASMPRFAEKLADLKTLLSQPTSETTAAGHLSPGSWKAECELWLCGGGQRLATLAGTLGTRFAFHHYLHQARKAVGSGPEIAERYRSAFNGDTPTERPYFAVACYGVCTDTLSEAHRLWRANFGPLEEVTKPCFLGPPAQCLARLCEIQSAYQADEIVVQSMSQNFEARLRSYELLSNAAHN